MSESTVHAPGGRPHPSVFTLDCADWCNVVAITDDDQLVLVRQLRFGSRAPSLELPGGMIAKGEKPAKAALRELREETGYVASRATLLVVVHPNPALQGNRHFAFLARGARLVHSPSFDEHEDCETVLVPIANAARLLDGGEMTHALCHAALSAFLRQSSPRSTASHMSKSALRKKKRPSATPRASASRRKS